MPSKQRQEKYFPGCFLSDHLQPSEVPETQTKATSHLYPISYGKRQAQINGKFPYDLHTLCWVGVWQISASSNGPLSFSRSLRQLPALEVIITDPTRDRPADTSQRFCAIYKSGFIKHFLMNDTFYTAANFNFCCDQR